MAAASSGSASDTGPFLVDNDEETFAFLLQGDTDVTERLGPLFERIRQDPIATAPWTRWTHRCQQQGIAVPSFPVIQVEKPQISQKIPGSFDVPAGKAHLKAVQAILEVEESTAAQITLTCMRDVPSQPGQTVIGSHALFEKVLDYAYRQRTVRLRVIAEALRAEIDVNHSHRQPLTDLLEDLDKKSTTSDGSKRGIFMRLLLTACATNTDLTREQLLPTRELWVQSPQEKRGQVTKEDEWRNLGHRIVARQVRYIHNARQEALEGLAVLLYDRMGVTRADYALLLSAFGEQELNFFGNELPRMGYLAGIICVEACVLWKANLQDDAWTHDHLLLRGTDQTAFDERRALLKLLEIALHTTNNKPQGLAALSFGCLLHIAGFQEGRDLAMTAINNCQADVYLEETMTKLVEAPSMEKEVISLNWCEASGGTFETNDQDSMEIDTEQGTELAAPCLLYATIGRELVMALITTFQELLLDPRRSSFQENINAMANLVKSVHCNSHLLGFSTLEEWVEQRHLSKSEMKPLHRVIRLSLDLAEHFLNEKKFQPLALLEAATPALKVASSLVSNPVSVYGVMNDFLPPNLLHACLVACLSSSTDPEKMQRLRVEILQSICLLVGVAQNNDSRSIIRASFGTDAYNGKSVEPVGPERLFRIATASGSTETRRLVSMVVSCLLPGAPPEWFLEATTGLQSIQQETTGGIFGREKGSTEALVHLTHTLVLEVNRVFFAGMKDDIILAGLLALTNALNAVENVLISSTSALSGNLFNGKPLPHKIASKILVTLGNALIMLRPLYFTHPSERVQNAVLHTINALVSGVSQKSGVGDSVFYFATLPAALGLAHAMRETARDTELARTARSNYSWGATSSNVNTMLAARIKELESVPVNLNALETDGWLRDETAHDVRQVSTAALRLLLLVFEHTVGTSKDISRELILSKALPCLSVRQSSDLSSAWSSPGVTYIQLLLRELHLGKKEKCISLASFALLTSHVDGTSAAFRWAVQSLPLFRNTIEDTFAKLKEQLAADASVEEGDARVISACLRMLASCLKSQIDVVDPKQERAKWATLIDCFRSFGKKSQSLSNLDVILCDECLRLLITLRKRQIAQCDAEYFALEGSFMSELASFSLVDFYPRSDLKDKPANATIVSKSNDLRLVSTCWELLAFEIQHAVDTSSSSPALSAVIGALESEHGLESWAEKALLMHAMEPFIKASKDFCEDDHTARGFDFTTLPNLIGLFGRGALSSSEAVSLWLGSLHRTILPQEDFSLRMHRLCSFFGYIEEETACAVAARCLLSLLSRDGQSVKRLTANFSVLMCSQVSRCLAANMACLHELANRISWLDLIVAKMSEISEGYAFLLAGLTSGGDSGWTSNIISEILGTLKGVCVHSLGHYGGQRQFVLVVHKILLVSTKLVKLHQTRVSDGRAKVVREVTSLQTDLARVACQVLVKLNRKADSIWEGTPDEIREVSECFSACVVFLRYVCTSVKSSSEPKYLSSVLSKILLESEASPALVVSVSDPNIRRKIGPEGILSVFLLFQSISTLENKQGISSLLESGIRPALTANFLGPSDPVVVAGVRLRGYVSLRSRLPRWNPSQISRQTRTQVSLQIGKEDNLHEIQIACTTFVANALRSVASGKVFGDYSSNEMRTVALDYLEKYGQHFLDCLQQVSGISSDSEVADLTIRSVREASSVLSLVAELCRRHNIDEFKRLFPALFKAFDGKAVEVARAMCSFLGAAGSCRELFRALGDEDGGSQNGDGAGFGLSPLADFISLSLSNPRHEAIRYSHFISRWSSAVTEAEHDYQKNFPGKWKPPNRRASMDDPNSESTLERKCKQSIMNKFSFTLEEHAGQCLYFAVDIMRKTHPMSSSFVMFSEDELRRMDTSRIIGVGTIIGYRDFDQRGFFQGIRYGEVKRVDVYAQSWYVAVLGEGRGSEDYVTMDRLVGVQDKSLRQPILKFSPAPEDSAQLEILGSTMSVGHLIAALRWCHEFSFQIGRNSTACRLAESLSALLVTEVSLIHQEPNKTSARSLANAAVLPIQLLDLYGADDEFLVDSVSDPTYARREGRLRQLLPDDCWQAIREQIQPELTAAMEDLRKRMEKKRSRSEGEGWLTTVRRGSPSRSPFRQLSG